MYFEYVIMLEAPFYQNILFEYVILQNQLHVYYYMYLNWLIFFTTNIYRHESYRKQIYFYWYAFIALLRKVRYRMLL